VKEEGKAREVASPPRFSWANGFFFCPAFARTLVEGIGDRNHKIESKMRKEFLMPLPLPLPPPNAFGFHENTEAPKFGTEVFQFSPPQNLSWRPILSDSSLIFTDASVFRRCLCLCLFAD